MARNGRLPKPILIKGIYYARRRVPKDLAPLFSGEFEMRSLQTRDPVEAAGRFPSVNNEIDAKFVSMRLSHGSWPVEKSELTKALVELLNRHLVNLPEVDKRMMRFVFNHDCPPLGDFDERFDAWPVNRRTAYARQLADSVCETAGRAPLPIPVETEFRRLIETGARPRKCRVRTGRGQPLDLR